MLYNLNNIDKIFYNNKEYSSIYIKNKEVFTNEKVEKTNEFIILYGGENSSGVRFLNPTTLDEVYYMNTGFPVFSIAYMGNDVFAVSSRNIGDISIYIYKLNRNNNNFELKDTIDSVFIETGEKSLSSFSSDIIKQTVFYYNSSLYFFNGYGEGSTDFEIIKMNYNTSNFSTGLAQIVYHSYINRQFQNYYIVLDEGDFQIIDNYFLTSLDIDISVYEILSNGEINQIGNYNYNMGNCYIGYPLKDGKYLLPGIYNSSSESALNLYQGETYIKTIDENISYFYGSYSKFSYFNNKYYIYGGENTKTSLGYDLKGIIEYDNETQTAKLLTSSMNMGPDGDLDSIIVSSKGNFYLKGSNIIKSYDTNYTLLIEKDNSLYSDYKVIDTVSL